MLDSTRMNTSNCGERGISECSRGFAPNQPAGSVHKAAFIGVFLFLFSLNLGLKAQQQPQSNYPDNGQNSTTGLQNPSSVDCTDPTYMNDPQCSGQIRDNGQQLQNPQNRYPDNSRYGNQTENPNNNYSDIEQFTRQPYNRNQGQQLQPGLQPQQERIPPEPLTEFQKFV